MEEAMVDVLEFGEGKHAAFIEGYDRNQDPFEQAVFEHLKINGIYWGLTAMFLLGREDEMDKDGIIKFVMACYHECGGFGGNIGHDPHLLYTLSAVQILALYDELDQLDKGKVAAFVASLQQEDGSFAGDEWKEIDTRFSYCALSCLAILGQSDNIDVKKATDYVGSCRNFDGGFGCTPGAESHAGQIFTCVGALSIGYGLQSHNVDEQLLGWWLAERQCDSGGLNGRPEKQSDVCYSWWNLSTMSILNKVGWIDKTKLVRFIIECQDLDDGGIADRPGNMADVYHTFFGICGLSLLGYFDDAEKYPKYRQIDPAFALPVETVTPKTIPPVRPYETLAGYQKSFATDTHGVNPLKELEDANLSDQSVGAKLWISSRRKIIFKLQVTHSLWD